MSLPYTKSETKEYFREVFGGGGFETVFTPSYDPFTLELDEKGIRHDIQHMAKIRKLKGFLLAPFCGSVEEFKEIMRIVGDEAHKQKLSGAVCIEPCVSPPNPWIGDSAASLKAVVDLIKYWEECGGESVFGLMPGNFYPETEEDIYKHIKRVADQIEMGINIQIHSHHMHYFQNLNPPEWISTKTLVKMADIPQVFALKIGTAPLTPEGSYVKDVEIFKYLGKKILCYQPRETHWPVMIQFYGQDCFMGHWLPTLMQTPDYTPLADYTELALNGDMEKAWEIYWSLHDIRSLMDHLWAPPMGIGIYPVAHLKYWEGLVGMTGGPLKLRPTPHLHAHEKEQIKTIIKKHGILKASPERIKYLDKVCT